MQRTSTSYLHGTPTVSNPALTLMTCSHCQGKCCTLLTWQQSQLSTGCVHHNQEESNCSSHDLQDSLTEIEHVCKPTSHGHMVQELTVTTVFDGGSCQ